MQVGGDGVEHSGECLPRVVGGGDVRVDEGDDALGQAGEVGADKGILGREQSVDAHLREAGGGDELIHADGVHAA